MLGRRGEATRLAVPWRHDLDMDQAAQGAGWNATNRGPRPHGEEDAMVTTADYGAQEAAMQVYLRDGERKAFELGNRGPIRFEPSGALAQDIVEAYGRCGFYVFEGVLKRQELADIEADEKDILERLPCERGATLDRQGRHALTAD